MNIRSAYQYVRRVTREHWLYGVASVTFVLLTSMGQLNFAVHTPAGYAYTGANPYTAADKMVYKNMIQQGREGILFMRNVHTTDPQHGRMLSPVWYVIGQTGAWFNLTNNAAYQIYRVLFTLIFCWLLYLFLAQLFVHEVERVIAGLFVYFSGGFGWLYLITHPWLLQASSQIKFFFSPVDLYVTEGNTLLNFAQAPLFSFSQVALVASAFIFVRYREKVNWLWDSVNAAIILVLGTMHPYDMPIVFAVLGSWTVWHIYTSGSWLSLKRFMLLGCAALITIAYNFYALFSEPVLRSWYEQNLVYSPLITNYLWGYGLLLPLALVGLFMMGTQKKHDPWWAMILIWCAIIPLLLYLPLDVNRRFINGWHIVLAITAYAGCSYLFRAIHRQWLRVIYVLILAVALGSSLGLYFVINLYFEPSAYGYGYYYITPDEKQVIDFLRGATTVNDHLLTSDMKTSFTLTSELNRLVFRGHDHQTPQAPLKQQQMDWFFSEPETSASLELRKNFLQQETISYIVVSSLRLGHEVQWLETAPFVKKVMNAGPLTVYRVVL